MGFWAGGEEVGSGGEGNGETAAGAQVLVDGEEHWAGTGPGDTGVRVRATEPVLLLAKEGCLGGAQVQAGGEAVDLTEANHYSSQPGH